MFLNTEKITLPSGSGLYPCIQTWAPYPNTSVRRGAVILCPGGGYENLSRTEGEALAPAFAMKGFSTFVLHYRVGRRAEWPNPLIDLAQAMQTVRSRADEWGIDPDKIAIAGFSAGGNLCALLSALWNDPTTAELTGVPCEMMRPNLQILGYPALNMRGEGSEHVIELIRGPKSYDETMDATDAILHAGPSIPETFLFSLFDDGAVPVEQGIAYAAKLAELDIPFDYHVFYHGEHAASLATGATQFGGETFPHMARWFDLCCKWLEDHFGAPELIGEVPDFKLGGDGRAHMVK